MATFDFTGARRAHGLPNTSQVDIELLRSVWAKEQKYKDHQLFKFKAIGASKSKEFWFGSIGESLCTDLARLEPDTKFNPSHINSFTPGQTKIATYSNKALAIAPYFLFDLSPSHREVPFYLYQNFEEAIEAVSKIEEIDRPFGISRTIALRKDARFLLVNHLMCEGAFLDPLPGFSKH